MSYSGSIIGVMCGMDATKNIDKFLQNKQNITIVKSQHEYKKKITNSLGLNETYEAKCLDFMDIDATLVSIAK
jgi:hypothetical protein